MPSRSNYNGQYEQRFKQSLADEKSATKQANFLKRRKTWVTKPIVTIGFRFALDWLKE